MATIHWLNEAGVVEAPPVCAVDFADDGMAVDFAHNLYRSVHAFGRSKPGFAITGDEGRCLYTWRWDDEAALQESAATDPREVAVADVTAAAPEPDDLSAIVPPTPTLDPGELRQIRPDCAVDPTDLPAAGHRPWAFGGLLRSVLRPRHKSTAPAGTALLRHFAPDIAPSVRVRRWRLEIDHYLLAIIVVLAILCGSPLCSIYATVQHLLRDEAFLQQDRSVVALATRAAARNVLATDGRLDFRKLFWHLRVVGPAEIHLLAYEPSDGQGPRLVFETSDLLRWRLQSVRGADGTWWARSKAINTREVHIG